MESDGSVVGGGGGPDATAELRPYRAVAAIAVAVCAALLGVVPAAIALGAGRTQLDEAAAWLGGVAAVVGVAKLAAGAAGIAGRLWSGHRARLASAHAG